MSEIDVVVVNRDHSAQSPYNSGYPVGGLVTKT